MGMMGMDGGRRFMDRETSKPKNVSSTLNRFWHYFRPRWYALILVLVFMFAATWTQVTVPELIGDAVDCYLVPVAGATCKLTDESTASLDTEARLEGVSDVALKVVALFLVGSVLSGTMFYIMTWVGQNALRDIRVEVFNHTTKLSLGYYTRHEAGNIMSRFTNDSETIQQVLSFALVNVVSGSLLIVWIALKMLQINAAYALLSLTVVPVMMGATMYFSTQARRAFRRSRAEMGSVNADLQESISGVRESQAFHREEDNIVRFQQVNAANRDANIRAASFTSALTPVLEALGYVAIALVVVIGGLSVLRNEPLLGTSVISIGTVIIFLQYIQRFNQPIQQISVLWTNIQSAIAGGERIFNLLDEKLDLVDKPNAQHLPKIEGRVEFSNVHAEYVQGELVLAGIDLTVAAGQTVAIVGPTGAGKTTIVNLIPRFYDVTGGTVKIDGYDVRDVTMKSLREQIGVVLQDSFLFSDTVMNNIRYGRLEASDAEVMEAAKLAYADTFIQRLPDGYQTILGERGSGLSQGQRQLISIARAALANPRILILDEATSSVDTRTEKLIQSALEKLLAGRTSFVIAHRLSTIRNANLVLMVQDGKIIERGTHQELLAQGGAYHDLYMSQFQALEDEAEAMPMAVK